MKTSVVFIVVALTVGGALAVMNNACKTSRHSWCAPSPHISAVTRAKGGSS
jgi:hypothetical protein